MNSDWMNKPRSRRDALQSALGIGGVTAGGMMLGACAPAGSPDTAAKRVPVDFTDPAQSLQSFIKLTGDLDGTKETPGWFGGTIFGDTKRNRPLKPLIGVQGFGVVRTEKQPDGSFRVFNRELAFYTDLKTGKFIDKWTNPYTKEVCDVKPIHNMTVNAHLIVSEKVGTAIEMDFDGTLMEVPLTLGWNNFGDKLFSTFEVHTGFPSELTPEKWPRESAGKFLRIAEIFQRVANLADVENPDTTSADYSGTWTRIGPWLPWMRQGMADLNQKATDQLAGFLNPSQLEQYQASNNGFQRFFGGDAGGGRGNRGGGGDANGTRGGGAGFGGNTGGGGRGNGGGGF